MNDRAPSRHLGKLPEQLTSEEMARGRRLFRRFVTLNGAAVAFLLNDLLILYGIRNGLSAPQLAVMASFIHLTMPFMLLGKRSITRIGLARTWGGAWILRYLCGLLLIAAPLLRGFGGQPAVTALILAGSFGFSLFRSTGLAANSPLLGEITDTRDRGRFISRNWAFSQTTYLLAMTAVLIAMRFTDSTAVYQALIGAGCLLGFYSGTVLWRIPETGVPARSAQRPLKDSLKQCAASRRYRRLLGAWAAGLALPALTVPFALLMLKNGYGLSDAQALIFSLLILIGGVAAAQMNSALADRAGPRPLLLIYTAGFSLCAGYLALAPQRFLPWPAGLIFFIAGFCKTGFIVGISHYFLSASPEKDRVGISLLGRIFSGTCAGLAGSVLGAGLISLLEPMTGPGLLLYKRYFLILLCLNIPLFILVLRLEKLREWHISRVFSLLFSMRDLRALAVLNRLEKREGSREELKHIEKLKQIGSELSESTLRDLLGSPRLPVRARALQALRELNLSEASTKALIEEVRDGAYTSGWVAAEILGEQGKTEALPVLREALHSEDPFLTGKAMVALIRLQDSASVETVYRIFRHADNPRLIIHGATALMEKGDTAALPILLEKLQGTALPLPVRDELLNALAALCGAEKAAYPLLRLVNSDKEEGGRRVKRLIGEILGETQAEEVMKAALDSENRPDFDSPRVCAAVLDRLTESGCRESYGPSGILLRHLQEKKYRGRISLKFVAVILTIIRYGENSGECLPLEE